MANIQLALVVLGITFQSCRTQQQGVCYQSITYQRSFSTNVRQSYETYYQCWWSRCSRTRYRQQLVTRYQTEYSSQFYCCAGYQPCGSDSTCCPICSPSCEEWEVCTAPNTCDCPTGYSGNMCADPLCTNCDSNHTCVAAEMCVCPTGWTGSDCHTDINECEENVAHCHHSCTNLDGGYICTCEIGYALSNDLQSCLGSPRNVTLTGITSTTLLLRWKPPEEDPGSGTILQYSIMCSDGDSLPQHRLSVLNQSLQLMDLRPFTSYNCCVSAQKSNGNSLDSCSSQTTSEDVPGDFPENLIMTNRSSHAVLIEWSPPNEPNGIVTGYTIYVNYDNDTSEPERVLMTDGSTLRYTLENLLAFQLVSVQMTANTSAGEGPRSGSVEARTNPTAPSSAPQNIAVDLQTPSFSWSPPPLLDQNSVITKYTVKIVEVESGRRIQQLDVNSTTTSVALPDLTLTPCYTYQFSVTAYTVEYGPSAMLDVKTISGNSTALLCFRLVNDELEMEDVVIDEVSQIISTQVLPNTMQARNISYIKFTNISTRTDGGSETALVVFLQFGTGAASRDTEEALGCWLAETSSIDINGISLQVMDPPTCLPNYEKTDCLKLQRSTDNCDEAQHTVASTSDRDIILSVFGGLLGALILLSLLVVAVIALVIRTRKNSKQEFTPPMESEHILHNPLYGEKPKRYVDNPAYNTIPKSEQLEAEKFNKDETAYMYVDPKSSHSHEHDEVPPAVPHYSESNQYMHRGNKQLEPEYASLKPTTAVYENIGHPDSQIVQEEFHSNLNHFTGN